MLLRLSAPFSLFLIACLGGLTLPACAPREWAPQAHLIIARSPSNPADFVAANETLSAAGFTRIPPAAAQTLLDKNLRCLRSVAILSAYQLDETNNIVVLVVRYIRDGRLGVTMIDISRAGYAFNDSDLGVFAALNAKLGSKLGPERIIADDLPGDKIATCL